MIRVLSLWQPWATLIAIGAKRFETRSWSTPYRGRIAIHAAKTWNKECRDVVNMETFRSVLMGAQRGTFKTAPPTTWIYAADYRYKGGLPHGSIVAVADLTSVIPTGRSVYLPEIIKHSAEHEQAFGNYDEGRFAWKLENVVALKTPVPCVGHQGLFFPKPDELAALDAALQEVA